MNTNKCSNKIQLQLNSPPSSPTRCPNVEHHELSWSSNTVQTNIQIIAPAPLESLPEQAGATQIACTSPKLTWMPQQVFSRCKIPIGAAKTTSGINLSCRFQQQNAPQQQRCVMMGLITESQLSCSREDGKLPPTLCTTSSTIHDLLGTLLKQHFRWNQQNYAQIASFYMTKMRDKPQNHGLKPGASSSEHRSADNS